MKSLFKFSERPNFKNPSLIVGWERDSGKLSPKVIEYLNKKINSRSFCEIEPVDFFSLAGVTIENNTAQFPESKFYYSQRIFYIPWNSSPVSCDRVGIIFTTKIELNTQRISTILLYRFGHGHQVFRRGA